MEITHTKHDSGTGIYAMSHPVTAKDEWNHAEEVGNEMCQWLDETNGNFTGEFKRAFAIAHAQVVDHDHPLKLFVVDKELVVPKGKVPAGKNNLVNTFFEAQAIFNCEVLDAPDKVTVKVPQRKVERKGLKAEVNVEMVEKEVNNEVTYPEGCMSFPHRSQRNTHRKFRIKVRYQWLGKGLLGGRKVETFEGWVEGLKAHIIQHETDHFICKNIHFGS